VAISPQTTDAILFLDETGTTNYFSDAELRAQRSLIQAGKKPTVSTIFGLGGVLMLGRDYPAFRNGLSALKAQHFGTDAFALHEYDIRKMKKAPFNLLKSDPTWQAFYGDLGALLRATRFLVIVATVDKIAMQERYTDPMKPYHPYQYSLHVILERVINEKGYGSTCQVVAEDRDAGVNSELRAELLRLEFFGGTIDGQPTVAPSEVQRRIDPKIEFYKKSQAVAGLELADLCAGPVTRWLHSLGSPGRREVLPLVLPRLRCRWDGKQKGYGAKCLPHYPTNCPAR
jgi:hypothetical protein